MNSRERVIELFESRKPDRVAVMPQIGDHAGHIQGLTFDVLYHDAKKAYEAHLKAYQDYGYDVLAIQVEPSWPVAEACGCEVTYPPNKCPWVTKNVIKILEDVDKVKVPDFWAHPGTATILNATRMLADKLGDEVAISGYMTGPLTFALQLIPYNDFIIASRKNPELAHAVVDKATQVAKGFAKALAEAGAQIHVICEHDLQMFSPKDMHSFILPRIAAITAETPYNVLHTCGQVGAHLKAGAKELCQVPNLQFVNFSHEVSIFSMLEVFGQNMGLCGNIDHIQLLPHATPEEVSEACGKAIKEGMKAKAFMLGPGCEITIDTPPENIKAFVKSAELYGTYL
ncbi:MAG: uroporphyrinogen decarboxylase family protein [Deltaproteobacteria bacterium]|nr:uroporphyrinogen decarboxylase family protein [Deltaproteobacteria bacterium]